MNRTSIAAMAICLAAGMAGLAQAQTSPSTTASPGMGGSAPSLGTQPQTPPSSATSPSYNTSQSSMPQNSMQGAAARPTRPSQADIQQAQQQLKAQGLYRGAIDGEIGPKTKMAISRFQRRNGLPHTAMLDQRTLQRLMGSMTSGAGSTMAPTSPQATSPSAGSNMNSTAPQAPTKRY